jgi:hypothetical protein
LIDHVRFDLQGHYALVPDYEKAVNFSKEHGL